MMSNTARTIYACSMSPYLEGNQHSTRILVSALSSKILILITGIYERPGNIGYKHIYFNATRQTLSIWIVTVLFVLLAYESIKYISTLIQAKNIRVSMLILYLINM